MDNDILTTDGNGVKIQDNVGKIESSNMFQSGGFWILFFKFSKIHRQVKS